MSKYLPQPGSRHRKSLKWLEYEPESNLGDLCLLISQAGQRHSCRSVERSPKRVVVGGSNLTKAAKVRALHSANDLVILQ